MKPWRWLAVLPLVTALSAGAGEEEVAQLLGDFLEDRKCCAMHWQKDSAERIFFDAASTNPRPGPTRGALAHALELPATAAALLLEAELLAWAAGEHQYGDDEERALGKRFRARAESAFESAARLAPGHRRLSLELAAFYDELSEEEAAYAGKLADLLWFAPEAWELGAALEARTGFRSRVEVMGIFLLRQPDHPVLLAEQAKGVSAPSFKAAVLQAAIENLASEETPAASFVAYLAAERSASLLELGLLDQAVEQIDLASEPARKLLVENGEVEVDTVCRGHRFRGRSRDPRLELTAAYALAGRYEEAALLAEALLRAQPGPSPGEQGGWEQEVEVQQLSLLALLTRLWSDAGGDPFDAFVKQIFGHRTGPISHSMARYLALAAIAQRELYPAFERYFLAHACLWLGMHAYDHDEGTPPSLPAEILSRARDLAVDEAQEITELGVRIALLAGVSAVISPDFCAVPDASAPEKALALPEGYRLELLASEEEPEPEPVRETDPWELLEAAAGPDIAVLPGAGLPPGLEVVSWWREGPEIGAVVSGPAFGSSAYFLTRSFDGGNHWSPPLFTGLPADWPYTVVAGSQENRIAGGELHLEVRFRPAEIDTETGLWTIVAQRGLLTVPLAELARDRDRDGWTDLIERYLATDPERADTDSDGIADHRDPAPQLARRGPKDESPAADDAFLAAWRTMSLLAEEGSTEEAEGKTGIARDAAFVAGESLPWHVVPNVPWLLVLPESLAKLHSSSVARHPLVVQLFSLNRYQDKGLIVWHGPNGSGTLELLAGPEGWKHGAGFAQSGCTIALLDPEDEGDAAAAD